MTKTSSLKGLEHNEYSTRQLYSHWHPITTSHSFKHVNIESSTGHASDRHILKLQHTQKTPKSSEPKDGNTFLHRDFLNVGHFTYKNND